jgi:hypothetical protein
MKPQNTLPSPNDGEMSCRLKDGDLFFFQERLIRRLRKKKTQGKYPIISLLFNSRNQRLVI